MKLIIQDPVGAKHTLDFVDGEWHGYETIAHAWEPSARRAIIEQVLVAAQFHRPLPWRFKYGTR